MSRRESRSPACRPFHLKLVGGANQRHTSSAVAIAWLMRHPVRILPVVGTNNLSRIARIGDAAKVEIDRQTWFELYTLAIGKEVP